MKMNARKGQSILEYTLLLGAIIGILAVVLLGSGTGGIRGKVGDLYNKTGNAMGNMTNQMTQGIFNF